MSYFSRLLVLTGCMFIMLGGLQSSFADDAETVIEPAVVSFKAIGVLRKQSPVDAEAIAEEYAGELQTLTKQVDEDSGLNLDSDILAAIDAIRDDSDVALAVQVIDKTVQRVFFETIVKSITSVRNNFDSETTAELNLVWDEAVAAFEAIKGTAARDNEILSADRKSIETGSNPALDVNIGAALTLGRTALNKANPVEDKITISLQRQVIRLSLARAYYIGVLREARGIVSNRDREIDKALEKQKEGQIFYRIIEGFISRDNSVGNTLIKTQLVENVTKLDADSIVSELNKGFIGRVRGELGANESSIGNDRGRAMEVALEASLYAHIFIPDLALRLGTVVRNNLDSAITDLIGASDAGDVSVAAASRQTISDILEDYENDLKIAKYNKTTNTAFVDPAVSAFQEIGVLRKQSPIDHAAITAAYTGELQQLSQFVDQLFNLNLDSDILLAIADIKDDKDTDLAVQTLDKTFQRIFALGIFNRVTLVLNEFDALSTAELELEWDRAFAAYLAIIGTAAKDNRVLTADRLGVEIGKNPRIDSQVTLAFIRGKQALQKIDAASDRVDLAIERETIVLSLARAFIIGVFREITGILSNRDRDIGKALEKQKEGDRFYAIIEPLVVPDNPSGNAAIKAQLVGDVDNVIADQIVSGINKGLIGQLDRNLDLNALAIGIDREKARAAAERVNLYAQIFLADLGLRLNSLLRVKLENALQSLKTASDANNVSGASGARQAIGPIIANYKSQLI